MEYKIVTDSCEVETVREENLETTRIRISCLQDEYVSVDLIKIKNSDDQDFMGELEQLIIKYGADLKWV